MTVGTQMQQAIAGVQSAAATMKTFALQTEDQSAKKDFQQLSKTFEDSLQVLNGRLKYIQEQEPQYKQE
ncbi:hypothetical protein J2Z42_000651 [Clostridium algifaecis]|uniref:DUF1657 domain-containing protein n=1 Tax=Clostridium algifaecis TaxID=1472040 RepID=A0ABS4KRG1_9CLOT|nr:DUF1657 domain-containing protein [Clostridium algifaecis]MBP2031986.1 hypothetical protein [Clostridium algifaecis]